MKKWSLPFLMSLAFLFLIPVSPLALEKIKFGTAVRLSAPNYLIVTAALERGLFKQNGLEAEWVTFRGGGPFTQALASGALKIGVTGATTAIEVVAKGVPLIIVSDWCKYPFSFWVRVDSRFKRAEDLVGARVGVSSLAGVVYSYARMVVKAMSIEKEVKFVGMGDLTTALAALKMGAIDVAGYGVDQMAGLVGKKEVRELVSFSDYMPKEWVDLVIQARKDFVATEPQITRAAIKASLQGAEYIRNDPRFAADTIKSMTGYPEETARLVYDFIRPRLAIDGRIDRRALENVRAFLIEYGLVAKGKAPSLEEIYTDQFVK